MPKGRNAKDYRGKWLLGSLDPKDGWIEFVEFFEEWMKPFFKLMREEGIPEEKLVANYFGLDHRSIKTYRVLSEFNLSPNVPFKRTHEVWFKPNEELRRITPGDTVLIRVDNRALNFHIELQVVNGGLLLGEEDERRIFLLTPSDISEITRHLKFLE